MLFLVASMTPCQLRRNHQLEDRQTRRVLSLLRRLHRRCHHHSLHCSDHISRGQFEHIPSPRPVDAAAVAVPVRVQVEGASSPAEETDCCLGITPLHHRATVAAEHSSTTHRAHHSDGGDHCSDPLWHLCCCCGHCSGWHPHHSLHYCTPHSQPCFGGQSLC